MRLKSKDLLGLRDISKEEIQGILDTAKSMKQVVVSDNKKTSHMTGKSLITLFYENSTRTRLSFELAGKYMSCATSSISATTSSVSKGETLIDTGKTIDIMGTDVIIMRHSMSGAPHLLAKNVKASVINAGDGTNEHPTQGLLDMYTMIEKKGSLKGLKVAIIGDVLHSRVARSNIWGLTKMGARVCVAAPSTLIPKDIEKTGIEVYNHPIEAVLDADVVMCLRIQAERQKTGLFPSNNEYARFFGVNEEVLSHAKSDALLMHPGPANKGVEITSSVYDSEQSVINEQVLNGVAIRMAVLYLITRGENK